MGLYGACDRFSDPYVRAVPELDACLRVFAADPTADVGGWDAQAKLLLLTKLAFGVTLTSAEVPCVGITQIEL